MLTLTRRLKEKITRILIDKTNTRETKQQNTIEEERIEEQQKNQKRGEIGTGTRAIMNEGVKYHL